MIDVFKVLLGVFVGFLLGEWKEYKTKKREEKGLGAMIATEVWLLSQVLPKDIKNIEDVIALLSSGQGNPSIGSRTVKRLLPIYEANLGKLSILPQEVLLQLIFLHDFTLSVTSRMSHLHEMFENYYSNSPQVSQADLLRGLERQKDQFKAMKEITDEIFPVLAERYWTKAQRNKQPALPPIELGFKI